MFKFLKKAFADMKESAKMQHEIDKANFNAVKAESSIPAYRAKRRAEQEEQLAAAKKREAEARARAEQGKN